MKCNFCEREAINKLSVGGVVEREWFYCKEHYLAAKVERNKVCLKVSGRSFDDIEPGSYVPFQPLVSNMYVSD